MAYVADGKKVDGSWNLNILVTDLQLEKTLRVTGDVHVGGVMLQLVQALDIALDWSDHALWWPDKNRWLLRSRTTLDQYNVQADAKIHFTPMHKNLKVQLPDLQILDLRVDFSTKCFTTVVQTCKDLGIRHPEELSFMRKWDKDDLKQVAKEVHKRKKKADPDTSGTLSCNGTLDTGRLSPYPSRSPTGPSPTNTLTRSGNVANNLSASLQRYTLVNGTLSQSSAHNVSFENNLETSLTISPNISAKEAFQYLHRPKNMSEKARINCAWLDSSASLMEQGIKENDHIMLKFKFYQFYDLTPKYDPIRINQIYEQARWALISEEMDCTEEEMMVFAALQFQIQLQSSIPQPDLDASTNNHSEDDEIDAALRDLQEKLEGSAVSASGDITQIPELCDYVKFFKPKKLTLKSYKRYFATFRDTFISLYRSQDETQGTPVMPRIDVKGSEAQPDVNLSAQKYGIRLCVPDAEGLSEMYLRFDKEEQYCRWMAACKLASKGKTMADSSYEAEVQALQTFLSMQHPVACPQTSSAPAITCPESVDIHPEDYIASRFVKKLRTKALIGKIMEAHASIQDMNMMEAKLAYIKAWQSLPEYGITYFRIKMANSKKEELMGVAPNRVMRMDLNSGDVYKTWRYNTLLSWHVNWEVENVILDFQSEKVTFSSMECSCKTIHEYIGGYIFLSLRSTEKNQSLNEEMFHKLTGGWHE